MTKVKTSELGKTPSEKRKVRIFYNKTKSKLNVAVAFMSSEDCRVLGIIP